MLKNSFINKSYLLNNALKCRFFIWRFINLLLGFFLSTVLSTLPGQTGDWTIIGASVIVSFTEYLSLCLYTYSNIKFENSTLYYIMSDLKIGIMYGLFVDSFKLGS